MLFVTVTSALVVSHATYMAANRKEMDVRQRLHALAEISAKNGLVDALGWLRRQPTQPVTAFSPRYDPGAQPPLLDTIDPALGLVREFEIRGSLWARYEVRRDETHDVSARYGEKEPGIVWDIGARGYVYRRIDPSKPFDEPPNRVLAVSTLRTEVRGSPVVTPAPASLALNNPYDLKITGNVKIQGGPGGAGVVVSDAFVPTDDVAPAVDPLAEEAARTAAVAALETDVQGNPPVIRRSGFAARAARIFSLSLEELEELADIIAKAEKDLLEYARGHSKKGKMSGKFIFCPGDLVLTGKHRIKKDSVLVVNGDLKVQPGADVVFRGLIFVARDVEIASDFSLKGMLIAGGKVSLDGSNGPVDLRYRQKAIRAIRKLMAVYRLSRSLKPGDD